MVKGAVDYYGITDPLEWIRICKENPSIEFLYLVPVMSKDDMNYNPYYLKIGSFQDVDRKDYLTISSHGVTRVAGKESEFLSLQEWLREYSLYHRLRKLETFTKFGLQKIFNAWEKKSLCPTLLSAYSCCFDFSQKQLFNIDKKTTYSLQKFEKLALENIEQITEKAKDFKDNLTKIIYEICCSILWQNGFVSDFFKKEIKLALPDYIKERTLEKKVKVKQTDEGARKRFLKGQTVRMAILEHDDEEFEEHSCYGQSVKRRICLYLSRFILLNDYFAASIIHQIVTNTYKEYLMSMEDVLECTGEVEKISCDLTEVELEDEKDDTLENEPSSRNNALFSILLKLETMDGKKFETEPEEIDFIQCIDRIYEISRKKIYEHKLFSNDPLFDYFVRPTINSIKEKRTIGQGPNLGTMFNEDAVLKSYFEKIKGCITEGFKKVHSYASSLCDVKEFHLENINANLRNILEETIDVETLSSLLAKYHNQKKKIEDIVDWCHTGLLLIDNRKVKDILLPTVNENIKLLHEWLPKLAKKNVSELIVEVHDIQTKLDYVPTNSKEYVEFLTFLTHIQLKIEFEEEIRIIKELYNLMTEYKIEFDQDDYDIFINLTSTIEYLSFAFYRVFVDKAIYMDNLCKCLETDKENLREEIFQLRLEAEDPELLNPSVDIADMQSKIKVLLDNLTEIQKHADDLNSYQDAVQIEVTKFKYLEELRTVIQMKKFCWDTISSWNSSIQDMLTKPLKELDADEINKYVSSYINKIQQLENNLPKNEVISQLKKKVNELKTKLPVILCLLNPTMEEYHWQLIYNVLQQPFDEKQIITIENLEKISVYAYADEIRKISEQATAEASLKTLLKKVKDAWEKTEYVVLPYKSGKDVYILGGTDDIQALLEDSMMTIATIQTSKHVTPIKSEVEEWSRRLELFAETLEEWLNCQKSWIYLENIFSAPDIQRHVPVAAKLFSDVDKSWKEIMARVNRIPLAMRITTQQGMIEEFQSNKAQLDQINACLEAYLESKRVVFPRFYFLSNDELLDILSETRNPLAVQIYLTKCFDAVAELEFGTEVIEEEMENQDVEILYIRAVISPEKEKLYFSQSLKTRSKVEEWLKTMEETIFMSIKHLIKEALKAYDEKPREKWIQTYPSQVVLTVSQIKWCQEVTNSFKLKSRAVTKLQEIEDNSFTNIKQIASFIKDNIDDVTRQKLCALISIDIYGRDVVTSMVKKKIVDINSFEWIKQLRYYWDKESDSCIIRMSNCEYVYGYEYLGASPRLVITPLTDRCFLCLMGALQLKLCAAVVGPAGTGKTETVKDLAKATAKHCVVFNCSEGLDYKVTGRFFCGMAQSGAWCCFDEFNRIDIEVLSVVAHQLLTIKNAKVAMLSNFMFEGREIKLINSCAAFITMNPGYAGRTELPDNLKSLFRPFSMMVPDYVLISEVTLYSEGFQTSKILAKKMTLLYKLCSEQLSQQDHYDFGMRELKSVLHMAGELRRKNPDKNEESVIIHALLESNMPKFLHRDVHLFKALLQDLFPDTQLSMPKDDVLQEALKYSLITKGLQPTKITIKKATQLFQTMVARHGVILVGPAGSGKTTCYEILKNSLNILYDKQENNKFYWSVKTHVLNPKSISLVELYGEINSLTLEWKDGLMGSIVRTAVQEQNDCHHWIICDGPVDVLWIENLNSVLDDNKTLCLANSERIKLTPLIHMLFEVDDLTQASPATISRCGMVYIDSEYLDWRLIVKTWLSKLPETMSDEIKKYLWRCFDKYVDTGLQFVKQNCIETIAQIDIGKISSLCSLLESLFLYPKGIDITKETNGNRQLMLLSFMFSYWWSIGGNLKENSMKMFDEFFISLFSNDPNYEVQTLGKEFGRYFIDYSYKRMESWESLVPNYIYENIPFFDIVVPTPDTIRFGYLMERCLLLNKSFIFTGPTGVGKSIIAYNHLKSISAESRYIPVFVNFTAKTTSKRTQEFIEKKLDKKRKDVYKAPNGKKIIIFIDDLNLPCLDAFGSQPAIELLRQYQDFRGFYDRNKLFWKNIQDVLLSAACAPLDGGRSFVTPRLLRHFAIFSIHQPQYETLKHIFTSIAVGFFKDFNIEVQKSIESIANAGVDLYLRMYMDFLPTPAKSHYIFNFRDLSKLIQGMLQVKPNRIKRRKNIYELFYHESARVFQDRLINNDDKDLFNKILNDISMERFNKSMTLSHKHILFGDFMKEEGDYELLDDIAKVKARLIQCLDNYNLIHKKPLKLIFFEDAIKHVVRIARIIRQERGNALLIGVGGCGKQSLAELSCHLYNYHCFQIILSKGYNYKSFQEDLKILYEKAGLKNQQTVFKFTDNQIVTEEFLEAINNILNSGEVSNLFEADNYEKMILEMSSSAKEFGFTSRDDIYDYFISVFRKNIHMILCMTPVGDAFRSRCRMFPSLVNCSTIVWFNEWPKEALFSIAESTFSDAELCCDELSITKLSKMCVNIHSTVIVKGNIFYQELNRPYYTTPTSYLELLSLYLEILEKSRENLNQAIKKFNNGLDNIYEAHKVIVKLKRELTAKEPELKRQRELTDSLLKKLASDQANADEVHQSIIKEKTIVKAKADETFAIQADAQKDLKEALPQLTLAIMALDAVDKNDIAEIRVFSSPPEMVQTVMEAVCILLNRKPDWATAKAMLGESTFLRRLRNYNKDNISEEILEKLKKYIENPKFVPPTVAKTSKACKSICMWVKAIYSYAHVYKAVQPKRERLAEVERELNEIKATLKEKELKLAEVESYINDLRKEYKLNLEKQGMLEMDITQTATQLKRASQLTSALSDEAERWKISLQENENKLAVVIGDSLLSAACIAYLGAFTNEFRASIIKEWINKSIKLDIPVSTEFNLIRFMTNPYEIQQWESYGLPRDAQSRENAILITRGKRWSLIIDPQKQANHWIKCMEQNNSLKVLKFSDDDFLLNLENCVRLGLPVLIEEVGETLDPCLESLMMKPLMGNRQLTVRLGNDDIYYCHSFSLYMTTKLANPQYLPEVSIKASIINFNVTQSGLEDQLLSDVMRLENPEQEEDHKLLIQNIAIDQAQLAEVQERILTMLYTSKGNILDDEELIAALNESNETASTISRRLQDAKAAEENALEKREQYRCVASRGSILYSVISSMSEIDTMYQYSLKAFNLVFCNCIKTCESNSDMEMHLQSLMKRITEEIFMKVSRGLFEEHKLIFSFIFTTAILKEIEIPENEWWFFLRGIGRKMREYPEKPANPSWLSESNWQSCYILEETLPSFVGLSSLFVKFPLFITIGSLEVQLNPDCPSVKSYLLDKAGFNEKFTDFQKLILIKTFQEDKIIPAITEFIIHHMGSLFIENSPINLQTLFQDMSKITPLIFILSSGSDPMSAFLKFASKKDYLDRIYMVSLGQRQGPVAENIINNAKKNGNWVFLQNCHLAQSWMVTLETIVQKIYERPKEIHENFRLFLSSMPSKSFPVTVLQNSIKVISEPPKGLRGNLKRTFQDLDINLFEKNMLKLDWRKMIFGLCFFHAVILERKKFGSLGWNIKYEFSDNDCTCAIETLKVICKDGIIHWDALEYLTGEITYGGRVMDMWDLRCLRTVLKGFFSPDILRQGYKYSASGIYYAPEAMSLDEYRAYIDSLPLIDKPEIFGMHENANISYQVNETTKLISTILEIQPKSQIARIGKYDDEVIFQMTNDILEKLDDKLEYDGFKIQSQKVIISSIVSIL
ncbi:dynein axonemal heavy chain 6 isoform X2 [Centruroides vittatus]|uniref:dynein axonemal heavy chain 6 isoform X2 n=1 Tax=Centruroides vittatus TaxID=120091 RepID=UPI00350FB95A